MQPVDLGVPGPSTLDMARAFRSVRRDPLTFLTRVQADYGDRVAFPVPGAPALLLNDPDDVRHVLQTAARTWSKRTVQYAALARVTGPGLLASAEPNWIEHRRAAAPAFHHQRLAAVGDQVRAAADDALASLPASGPGRVVDVATLMHRFGLDAVGRALFSADLGPHAQDLLHATAQAAGIVVRLGRAILPTTAWAPTPVNVQVRRTRRRLDAVTGDLIAHRRAHGPAAAGSATDHYGDDLLGLLLDSGLTDREIRDELVTMIIAGHETVAAALTWTLMLLAEHPEAQERARAELAGHGGPVSLLKRRTEIPWTRAVIDEALRLRPPAWVVSRRAEADDELDGFPVPAGTLAIISPWLVHRRATEWPDPEEFRPERFLDEGAGRRAYLPFGQGPRLCIGRDFALGEMAIVLDRLLATHRVSLPAGWRRPAPQADAAAHPRGGMPLLLTPISGGAG